MSCVSPRIGEDSTQWSDMIVVRQTDLMVPYALTRSVPDFHDNGDTVDFTDKCYDGPMESTVFVSSEVQYERPHEPTDLKLTTIVEEDNSLLANSKLSNDNGEILKFAEYVNEQIISSLRRSQSELEVHLKFPVYLHPATLEAFEEYMNFLRNTPMSGNNTGNNVENHRTPIIPPLPKLSTLNDTSNDVEYRDNNENLLFFESNNDKSANVSSQPLIDFTPCSLEIDSTSLCNGTMDEQTSRKIEEIFKVPETTLSRTDNSFIDIEPSTNENASFFPQYPAKNVTSMLPNERKQFEDTLSESAKNFFDRINASPMRPKRCYEPSIGQFSDTNPFRNAMKDVEPPPLPERSQLRKPQDTQNITTNSPKIHYEAGPVMYKNENNSVSSNERNSKFLEIAKEREEFLESKRMNVQSWIEIGQSSKINSANNMQPPPLPPRTVSFSNPRMTKQFNFDGVKYSDDERSDLSSRLSSAEWMDTVAGSFKKNEKTLISPEISRNNEGINNCEYATRTKNSLKHTIERATTTTGQTVKREDTMKRENFSERGNVRQIHITNGVVFLIIYQNEGWLDVEEFAAAFTSNKLAKSMLDILKIQGVDISFSKISRSDNSSLFNELERFYSSVSKNHKIGDFLNLVPLKSTLKILRKLRIIDAEQVNKATKYNIFPDNSPVLSDIFKVITAWREIR